MDYLQYSSEDFALDLFFRKSILQPTAETNLYWEKWLSKYPEKAELLQEAKVMINALPSDEARLTASEVDHVWEKINDQLSSKTNQNSSGAPVIPLNPLATLQKETSQPKPINPQHRPRNYHQVGRVVAAASVVFAFVVSFLIVQQAPQVAEPEVAWIIKENTWGQQSTIHLSDGTKVQLNAGSKITYPEIFSTSERIVQLKGEAFFEVKKDQTRPFRVVSAGVVTEALGTSFNIRAYNSAQVKVALVTGKAKVTDQVSGGRQTVLILVPGEGAIRENEEVLNKFSFDPEATLAWKGGKVFFKEADEATVFTTLERWYGIEIITNQRAAKPWNYTATYRKKSLEHILLSMAFVMDFSFEIKQEQVFITYH